MRRYSNAASAATRNSVRGKASQTPVMPQQAASRKAMGRIRRKPRSREVIWQAGPLHRGEIHGQDDVEPGKERAGEIEPQALFGDLLEPGVPLTVEDQATGPAKRNSRR